MTTVEESVASNHEPNPNRTKKTIARVDPTASTLTTTLAQTLNRPHPSSLASVTPDETDRFLQREENSRKHQLLLTKDRNLLVQRRLALKRQRAAIRGPSLQYEPVRSESYQMELGNAELDQASNEQEDQQTVTSPGLSDLKHGLSNMTTTNRGDTPHTVPTDIGLRYREKPLLYHPVTGQFIVHYAEDSGNPSPCAYVLPRKSFREKNAPAFTFGKRCLVEKKGGSRTAWQKQWFAHSNPFTTKVDFNRETSWPTPFHYTAQASVGFQSSKVTFPSWSMAPRLQTSPTLIPEESPSPDTYDIDAAFRKLTAKSIPITLKSRPGGTQIATNISTDMTPGPGAHDDRKFLSNHYSAPKHSFGKRIPISLRQDPYVNVIPINRA